MIEYDQLLAPRTARMRASIIREVLKVAQQPGVISLAGGIPPPESFPLQLMGDLSQLVIRKYGAQAFQYDLTEGFIPLREQLAVFLGRKGIQATMDSVRITSGSQSVLDLIGKILLAPGDKVAVEAPTYLGAIQSFNPYEADYVELATDADGLIPQSLDDVLGRHRIKLVYLVPTFQNPTGRTLSLVRRQQVAEIIQRRGALLVEDEPYSELRYRGESLPPIASFAPDNVVYAGTFSKIFSPGLRIGYYVAPAPIAQWMTIAKQGSDLHSSTFGQALAAEYLAGGHLQQVLPGVIQLYRGRQEALFAALQKYFPSAYQWNRPEGGMFVWIEGPQGLDSEKLYWHALEQCKVAFLPGKFFYTAAGAGANTMRLNFTMSDEATLDRAVRALAGALPTVI